MKCRCGYAFTFHPSQDGLTDGKFIAILNAASGNGTYYFTLNQLYATYCRKVLPRKPGRILISAIGAVVLSLGAAGLILQWEGPSFFPFIIGLFITFIPWLDYLGRKPKSYGKFKAMLDRWKSAGKSVDYLITEPTLDTPPPNWTEEDIYDYGAERVIIVDRKILVDWLVLNGFHASERAVVVSESGYPSYLMPRVMELLANQPDLPVYLLHDASPEGVGLAGRVRDWTMGHTVIDLGIHPVDVARIKRLQRIPPERADGGIPVDYLPFLILSGGMAVAMTDQVSLGTLLSRPVPDEGASGSFG